MTAPTKGAFRSIWEAFKFAWEHGPWWFHVIVLPLFLVGIIDFFVVLALKITGWTS